MYRLRKVSDLVGPNHNELENQEIYFAQPDSLNDPMEGFRNFFWSGDLIIWRNLFRHYLLCLENTYILTMLVPDDRPLTSDDISIFLNDSKLPSDSYREMYRKTCERFFQYPKMTSYMDYLASRKTPVDRDELYVHLTTIHMVALESVIESLMEHKIVPPEALSGIIREWPIDAYLDALFKLDAEQEKNNAIIKAIFAAQKRMFEERNLRLAYNQADSPQREKKLFILSEFSNEYLNQITNLTFPGAYVACFMKECTNAVIWSLYGNEAKGVCLKFRTTELAGHHSIVLNCVVGAGSRRTETGFETNYIRNDQSFEFQKVVYDKKFPSTDFFRSLGVLPLPQLMSQWYTDSDGSISQCAKHMESAATQLEWRKEYWKVFEESLLIKTKDWEKEDEYRIVLADIGGNSSGKRKSESEIQV